MNEIESKKTKEILLMVSVGPHISDTMNIGKVMRETIIALLPAAAASVYFFGIPALRVILIAVITSMLCEYLWQKSVKQPVKIADLSAALTGLLLALTLPSTLPWWMVVVGSVVSVILGKQVFGGLGHNPFNPALVGRAFLQISWPQAMTNWVSPFDAVTTATPLAINKGSTVLLTSYRDLITGAHAGSLGETSAAALILGGIFLLMRGHIVSVIPFAYIGTVAAGAFVFGQNIIFHSLSGGLLIGALFMATDPVTSPISNKGKLIFGIGCGLLTILIRLKGGFPEGVCFSILIMNMVVPLIDQWSIPRRFGA